MSGNKNMPQNKNSIQQRIELDRKNSPINELNSQQIAQKVGEFARKEGIRRPDVRQQISNSLRHSEAYKVGIKNRDQSFRENPEYQIAHKHRMESLHKDPKFIESHRKGIIEFRNDKERMVEFHTANREAYLKAKEDPEYWEKYYAAIEKRDADPEYHRRRIAASNAKIAIKISTPAGEFDSISEAARHYNLTSEGMRHRVNSDKYPDFKKIEK